MATPRGKSRSGSRPRGASRGRRPSTLVRWLFLALGLALAGLALYAMVTRLPESGRVPEEIGEDSRARLESVLRDAERADGSEP